MSYKVVALVYPTDNGQAVTDSSNDVKRALRSLRSSLSAGFDGRACYTSWGDQRAQDPDGNPVLGYAITMEVQKDEKDWFLKTFWGASEERFVEVIPGVGYIERSSAHAPMFSLDVANLEQGVKDIVSSFDIDFVEPTKAARKASSSKPTDPYGTVVQLLALCNEAVDDFDVAANLSTSRSALVELYETSLAAEDDGSEVDSDDAEEISAD